MKIPFHQVFLSLFDTASKFFIIVFAFLLITGFETAGIETGEFLKESNRVGHSAPTSIDGQPYIEPGKLNITVFLGQTVYLPCVVKHIGDKTVSWIRRRDLHILTSGSQTYTSDPRVSILREGKLFNSWILKIMTVGKKDEGYYECQVNTEPKLTASYYLIVFGSLNDDSGARNVDYRGRDTALPLLDVRLDPRRRGAEAQILGSQVVYVKNGFAANFTCIISHPSHRSNITWYLDDTPIQRSSATRGGISLEIQKKEFNTISKLVIARVYSRDEGKYTCGGEDVTPASVYLRIAPYNSVEEERVNELSGPMLSIANSNVLRWSQDKERGTEMFSFFIDFPLSLKSSSLLSLPFLNLLLHF